MRRVLYILAGVGVTNQASANVIWPALVLEIHLISWAPILAGLLCEFIAIRRAFSLTLRQTLAADFLANLGSTIIGILLIPLAGLLLHLCLSVVLFYAPEIISAIVLGTTLIALAATLNAAIESNIIKRIFHVPVSGRAFGLMVAANCVSVGIAFGMMFLYPQKF